jgi:hypothetical protein
MGSQFVGQAGRGTLIVNPGMKLLIRGEEVFGGHSEEVYPSKPSPRGLFTAQNI